MRPALRILAACAVLGTSGQALHAQAPERRVLAWSDFAGSPDPGSPFDAHTYWHVYYRFDAPARVPGGYRLDVKVWNLLEPRSWVKPEALRRPNQARLLRHEQGHYDIGLLCALRFRAAANRRLFSADYQAEVRALFQAILAEARQMDLDYDADTRHMKDEARQAAWNRRLEAALAEAWGAR